MSYWCQMHSAFYLYHQKCTQKKNKEGLTSPSMHGDSLMAPQHPKNPTTIMRAPAAIRMYTPTTQNTHNQLMSHFKDKLTAVLLLKRIIFFPSYGKWNIWGFDKSFHLVHMGIWHLSENLKTKWWRWADSNQYVHVVFWLSSTQNSQLRSSDLSQQEMRDRFSSPTTISGETAQFS